VAPPNIGSDSPAPAIANLQFDILQLPVDNQDKIWASAKWQNSSSLWRSWLLWSNDAGATWYWKDWWLSGGLSPSDCMGAYQAIRATSQADSYTNLNDPGTNDITAITAPAWSADTGWTFTAASNHELDTGLVPVTASSMFCAFQTTSPSGAICGAVQANENFFIRTVPGYPVDIRATKETSNFAASGISTGTEYVAGLVRLDDGRDYQYMDGSSTDDIAGVSITTTNPILLGNLAGPGYMNGIITAFVAYNTALTAAQAAAISNVMAVL